MFETSPGKRTDSGSRLINAAPEVIYAALVDPDAIVRWRPPAGMRAEMYTFELRDGGAFRMAQLYLDTDLAVPGKSGENVDVIKGRFAELVPDRRVVELIEFESDDPAFAGTMKVITTLRPVADGTEVTIDCVDVPNGIRKEDHLAGIGSTLANLAALVE